MNTNPINKKSQKTSRKGPNSTVANETKITTDYAEAMEEGTANKSQLRQTKLIVGAITLVLLPAIGKGITEGFFAEKIKQVVANPEEINDESKKVDPIHGGQAEKEPNPAPTTQINSPNQSGNSGGINANGPVTFGPVFTRYDTPPLDKAKLDLNLRKESLKRQTEGLSPQHSKDVLLNEINSIDISFVVSEEDVSNASSQLDLLNGELCYLQEKYDLALELVKSNTSERAAEIRQKCHFQKREFAAGFTDTEGLKSETVANLSARLRRELIEALEHGSIYAVAVTTQSVEDLVNRYDALLNRNRGSVDPKHRLIQLDGYCEKILALKLLLSTIQVGSPDAKDKVKWWLGSLTVVAREKDLLANLIVSAGTPLGVQFQLSQLANLADAYHQGYLSIREHLPENKELQKQWAIKAIEIDKELRNKIDPVITAGGDKAKAEWVTALFGIALRAMERNEMGNAYEHMKYVNKLIANPDVCLRVSDDDMGQMKVGNAEITLQWRFEQMEAGVPPDFGEMLKLADGIYDYRQFVNFIEYQISACKAYLLVIANDSDSNRVSMSTSHLRDLLVQPYNSGLRTKLRSFLDGLRPRLGEGKTNSMLELLAIDEGPLN